MRSETEHCVFRTGQLFEADRLCSTLEDEGIPYYRRQETSGGIEYAMPAAPAAGPGVWFTVWIPAPEQERVEQIIQDLRLEQKRDPGVWDVSPTPGGRRLLYGYALLLLLFMLFLFLKNCAGAAGSIVG